MTNGWQQSVLDLSGFAGDPSVRLRFDFSTAGDMAVSDEYVPAVGVTNGYNSATDTDGGMLGGAYLSALPSDDIWQDQLMTIADDQTSKTKTFAFDFGTVTNGVYSGAVIDVPQGAGALLSTGQTFTVTGPDGQATFEINAQSGSNVEISILAGNTPQETAQAIVQAINLAGLGVTATSPASALNNPNRVEIENATSVTVSPAPAPIVAGSTVLSLEGIGVGVPAGDVPIPVTLDESTANVALPSRLR